MPNTKSRIRKLLHAMSPRERAIEAHERRNRGESHLAYLYQDLPESKRVKFHRWTAYLEALAARIAVVAAGH